MQFSNSFSKSNIHTTVSSESAFSGGTPVFKEGCNAAAKDPKPQQVLSPISLLRPHVTALWADTNCT